MNLIETIDRGFQNTETASEVYDGLTFVHPETFFNKPAPEPWVAIMIGTILLVISFIWWMHRVAQLEDEAVEGQTIKRLTKTENMNLYIRILISAAIDNNRNLYAIVTYSATSFFFLAGIQLAYHRTLVVMITLYTFTSSLETIRVILAYHSADEKNELILSSKMMQNNFNKFLTKDLHPKNVYEDLGRNLFIVYMIFITQFILISFVCIDILQDNTCTCLDGTKDCPIAGTLGSWCFFILGIFMALVFQLGPKTNFGESEQNPAYWLRLLLVSKREGTHLTYVNDVKGNVETKITVNRGDFKIWLRFILSFLINGVGFHILVHALPLQIASQSSLTGVVFRAVGMMYLVDLDDTPGYKLTVTTTDVKEGTKLNGSDREATETSALLERGLAPTEMKDSNNLSDITEAIERTNALLRDLKKLVPAEET